MLTKWHFGYVLHIVIPVHTYVLMAKLCTTYAHTSARSLLATILVTLRYVRTRIGIIFYVIIEVCFNSGIYFPI